MRGCPRGVCREGSAFSVPLGVLHSWRMRLGAPLLTPTNLRNLLAIPVGMHGLPISGCRGNQRMPDSTILTVTSDQEFVALLRQQLRGHAGAGGPMIIARTIDEACSLVKTIRPRLVVVHWTRDGSRYEHLDRLLWTTSVLSRKVPVLVIAERYRIDQATMMFRMGVSEYISRTHHIEQLGQVFSAYLPPSPQVVSAASTETVASAGGKGWASNQQPQALSAQAV